MIKVESTGDVTDNLLEKMLVVKESEGYTVISVIPSGDYRLLHSTNREVEFLRNYLIIYRHKL